MHEDGNNNGGKIDECFNESHLDCKEVSKNVMLPSDNAKESVNLSATEVSWISFLPNLIYKYI